MYCMGKLQKLSLGLWILILLPTLLVAAWDATFTTSEDWRYPYRYTRWTLSDTLWSADTIRTEWVQIRNSEFHAAEVAILDAEPTAQVYFGYRVSWVNFASNAVPQPSWTQFDSLTAGETCTYDGLDLPVAKYMQWMLINYDAADTVAVQIQLMGWAFR